MQRYSIYISEPHCNILYVVSLLFASPMAMLHTANHFLDREVFDLLVLLIFFSLSQECSIYGLVYSLQYIARLDSSY